MQNESARTIQIDGVYDIETSRWDQIVSIGFWNAKDDSYREFWYDEVDEFITLIASLGGFIWAHAGGRYDHQFLLNELLNRFKYYPGKMLPASAGRIISAILPNKLRLMDSFALAPMKLKSFTKGLGVSKQELDLCDSGCSKGCDTYTHITRDMVPWRRRKMLEYMRADVMSLKNSLYRLRDYAAENDIDIGPTVGGSAWRNARRFLGLPDSYFMENQRAWHFCRSGSFGGDCQIYRRGIHRDVYHYDISGTYPAMLEKHEMPVGTPRFHFGADAWKDFANAKSGIYRATVTVPDKMYLPNLPIRLKQGGRIFHPTGTFTGTWAQPELEYAASLGVNIHRGTVSAMVWPHKQILFASWVAKIWGLRSACRVPAHDIEINKPCQICKADGLGEWLKFYGNSLTGKFGSRIDHETWFIDLPSPRLCKCKCQRCDSSQRRCRCHLLGMRLKLPKVCQCDPVPDGRIGDRVHSRVMTSVDSCSHIQWYSYLTAHTRIYRHQFQMSDGHDGLMGIMSDTDSLFSLVPRVGPMVGNERGQWHFEGLKKELLCIAPKTYWGSTADGVIAKAKGVKLGEGEIPEIAKTYTKEGISGFKAGLKKGLFKRQEQTRTIWERYGDRPLLEGQKVLTRAMSYDECVTAGFT